ncbi:MAG: hypothetical protein NVS3B12_09730 [Acidimicrobiales bacterium]
MAVRLRRPDGSVYNRTFRTRRDAEAFERADRGALDRGTWTDPRGAATSLGEYADRWLATRTGRGRPLAPRSLENYGYLLDRYIRPQLGAVALGRLTTAAVRTSMPTSSSGGSATAYPHQLGLRVGPGPRRRRFARRHPPPRSPPRRSDHVRPSRGHDEGAQVRLGHASSRTAPIYQHAAEGRDRALADTLEELVATEMSFAEADGARDGPRTGPGRCPAEHSPNPP